MDADPSCGDPESVEGRAETWFLFESQIAFFFLCSQAGIDMVSCHMDLKPENILFDGQHVWLTDWQAAFVNDRYFDLAVAANFLLTNDADELTYLERYFGQRPNEYQREILPYASGGTHVLRHGFPVAGFRGQTDRPK
jgi:thiamine kinase-like enzyme